MEAIETMETKLVRAELYNDDEPMNPREDYDNFGKMICFHRDYNLGDKHNYEENMFNNLDEIEAQLIDDYKPAVILPLYLYDHSGLTISTGPFDCRWDSGKVGFILVSRKDALKEFGGKRLTKNIKDKCEKLLQGEVETYDQYLRNDVYGYKIIDKRDDEDLDSCWGFFGISYAKEEMKNQLKYWERYAELKNDIKGQTIMEEILPEDFEIKVA